MLRHLSPAFLIAAVAFVAPAPAAAQPQDLLLPAQATSAASRRDVPSKRMRKARVNLPALNSAALRLHLFDDVQPTVTRRKLERSAPDKLVWVGDGDNGTQAVLTVAEGVLTGTVFSENRAFEIMLEPDGQYSVAELDPGAFPTDDPDVGGVHFEVLEDPAGYVGDAATAAGSPTTGAAETSGAVTMDVMVVWTPAAEAAAGGASAMQSLAMSAVANANLAYSNSLVGGQLRLVYAGSVNFVETPSNISGDLSALRSTSDGKMDIVHSLRDQHGADIVTLLGEGYRGAGYCGLGGLMTTVTTSFASNAFNVVDRSCAVGNMTFAHEVGHNQGLTHDPANAANTPSHPFAYGYQDPSGYFRTVLSYGSATRIPYLSSPSLFYNGLPTGTSSQDNARALQTNLGTIAAFRSAAGGSEPTPTPNCTYSVSTTSLSFSASGGSKSVSVTAPTGCTWSTASDTTVTWVGMSSAGGTGSGSVTVTVVSNSSSARSAAITIAGKQIAVTQSAPKGNRRK